MPRIYLTAAAVLSLAVSACAHTGAETTTPVHASYLGGRAGQPGGWAEPLAAKAQPSPNRLAAARAEGQTSYLGGRAAQPGGWFEPAASDEQLPESVAQYAYRGGRAGQPSGFPTAH